MLEEAERLSRLHAAPILIGDNERTAVLEFDRSKPIPLSVPIHNFCKLTPEQPIVDEVFSIDYYNDFVNFDDSVFFTLFSHFVGEPNGHVRLETNLKDRHWVRFHARFPVETHLSLCVWKDEEQLLWTQDFWVTKGLTDDSR